MASNEKPGRLIGGRYRLVEVLGAGAFGEVWRARDELLRVDVAAKRIAGLPGPGVGEQIFRAAREARNAAQLRDHPNVVGVHDVLAEDADTWIIMQLVDGCSLREYLDRNGTLTREHALDLARRLLGALVTAHAAGIVHRDIKPANIMMAADGGVLLADFGISAQQEDTQLTATGIFIGTPAYAAPERLWGDDRGAIGDLFSLGVTLYEAIEGRRPFAVDARSGTAREPTKCGELATLVMRLLRKDPQRRPTAATALAELPDRIASAAAPNTPAPMVFSCVRAGRRLPGTSLVGAFAGVLVDIPILLMVTFVTDDKMPLWGLLVLPGALAVVAPCVEVPMMYRQAKWTLTVDSSGLSVNPNSRIAWRRIEFVSLHAYRMAIHIREPTVMERRISWGEGIGFTAQEESTELVVDLSFRNAKPTSIVAAMQAHHPDLVVMR
ncbi:serine/threonine-protein kinase [Nocardia crassostreae]|uniref:serine/threonine-protein kinase n=1 Tax=Nocardia crassostreae TaxID=53428 RepID=UPI00082DE2C3|nr:serine/threonine-protein kinase [Nocardia crassostreae]